MTTIPLLFLSGLLYAGTAGVYRVEPAKLDAGQLAALVAQVEKVSAEESSPAGMARWTYGNAVSVGTGTVVNFVRRRDVTAEEMKDASVIVLQISTKAELGAPIGSLLASGLASKLGQKSWNEYGYLHDRDFKEASEISLRAQFEAGVSAQ